MSSGVLKTLSVFQLLKMDVRFLASIFLLFFFGPSLLSCQPNSFGPSCNRPLFPSDGNLLILQWPITFCYKQGRCSLKEPLHKWIIHGLWPQFNASNSKLAKEVSGSPYPQYCCHPQKFVLSTKRIQQISDFDLVFAVK